MIYIVIGLSCICIILTARYCYLQRSIKSAVKQMIEIEQKPEQNRQLKGIIVSRELEQLFCKINELYQNRQQERIIYMKRETQIRSEIENISHDLRTPLTSIIGYVDLIEDVQTTSMERDEYLKIIKKRARVLQGFIHDFYELSRMEGENYPIDLTSIMVQDSLSDVIVAYYHEFEKKQIHVEIILEEKPCFIIADQIQFNRILNNIIQNALKYASHTFIVKQIRKEEECILLFQNDKNQMREENLKLIFDRFYTGDLTRNNQNTGLGLTISKLLTEKMKGSIRAYLEGDLFTIELIWKA
ncbi:MAG: sensory transduction protein kinase [Herbinix sp.]|nr:sensory transduction protein kinase [Herbinix sp.]